MNTEKTTSENESQPYVLGAFSCSFSRLNDWFDSNAESVGKLKEQRIFTEEEAKRLCLKLSKELIDSLRNKDFHFRNMSAFEVLEYLLK